MSLPFMQRKVSGVKHRFFYTAVSLPFMQRKVSGVKHRFFYTAVSLPFLQRKVSGVKHRFFYTAVSLPFMLRKVSGVFNTPSTILFSRLRGNDTGLFQFLFEHVLKRIPQDEDRYLPKVKV